MFEGGVGVGPILLRRGFLKGYVLRPILLRRGVGLAFGKNSPEGLKFSMALRHDSWRKR